MQLSAISLTPSHRGSPAQLVVPLLPIKPPNPNPPAWPAPLGPGDRVGDLRVPGGRGASPHPLNRPPSPPAPRAPDCRLQEERELREQARRGCCGEAGGGRRASAGPTSSGSRSWSPRDIAVDCRPGALAAFVPRAHPGLPGRRSRGSPQAAEAAVLLPPRGGHPKSPGPAPGSPAPEPGPGPPLLARPLPRDPSPRR